MLIYLNIDQLKQANEIFKIYKNHKKSSDELILK